MFGSLSQERQSKADTFWALQEISFDAARRCRGRHRAQRCRQEHAAQAARWHHRANRGRIVIHGTVAALIEVGSGFHPSSPDENVFLSGAILGMGRREIAAKLESIVDFAGVGQFIDTPVKCASSGYVRLGFAVAAHLEADILLVDEVLAVGDAEFQVKCLQRIQELRDRGVTSLFISHDLTAVERLCDSAILLEAGKIAATGAPAAVVAAYHRRLALWDPESGETTIDSPKSGIALTNVSLRSPTASAVAFSTGAPLTIAVRYAAARPIANIEFEGSTTRRTARRGSPRRVPGEPTAAARQPPGGVVEFHCPALPLNRGRYSIGAVVRDMTTTKILAWWDGDTGFTCPAVRSRMRSVYIPHSWRLVHDDGETTGLNAGAAPPA